MAPTSITKLADSNGCRKQRDKKKREWAGPDPGGSALITPQTNTGQVVFPFFVVVSFVIYWSNYEIMICCVLCLALASYREEVSLHRSKGSNA
ncbi:hypothetical protein VNO78_22819 [Psophocarpus tetragonolobus]|uniref:Uncharacterized protein n=1 Tax=Psophocarpus tetragonolobus TaxID=3891 RepID=A0AAN9XCB2_PSOTE